MPYPSFFSLAGNFISTVQGGTDPRTGLFNLSLPLANLHSNNQAGPALTLSLQYSPLSLLNEGFGRGFSLSLTRYDTTTGRLTLSTGEEYRVSSSGNTVRQKKLRNFLFKKTGDNRCLVIHKSGLIEYLSLYGSIYLPVRITQPDGRSLRLSWGGIYQPARLLKVEDDAGAVLCAVSYPDESVATTMFRLLPDDAEYGYSIVFKFTKALLVRVTSNANVTPRRWTFCYDDVGQGRNWRVITGITSPTGLREEVAYYTNRGMAFPDIAGLPPLPCVAAHRIYPGGGQPASVTQWEWTQNNYLGKDAGLNQWEPDRDPMLNILLSDYQYGSTEKLMDPDGRTVLSTVTRRYNSYHLQVAEERLREGKIYRETMKYYAKPGATFDEQPAQYALSKQKTEYWWAGNDSSPRTSVTWCRFDKAGNLMLVRTPDGTVTKYAYYPAQGKGHVCPADPHGFIRYLRRKTVTPRKIVGDEQITVTVSTWKQLSTLSGDSYAVVPDRVIETTDSFRSIVKREYRSDREDALTYGREKQRTTTLLSYIKGEPNKSFTRTQNFTYDAREDGLLQSETLTTHDDIKVTRTTLRHPVLGHLLHEVGAQGVVVMYLYDKIGRVLNRIVAAGTPYERQTTWSYDIEATGPVTTETDPAGNAVKTFYDGAGRVIQQARFDNNYSKKWFPVSSQAYNSFGEVASGSVMDWITGTSEQYHTAMTAMYDGWGSISGQVFSEGITKRQVIDPVALTRILSVTGEANGKKISTGSLTTEFDTVSRLPIRVTLRDVGGNTQGVRQNDWDGLGRLILATDQLGHTTGFSYDGLGREKIRFLADGSFISRTYAPHLSGNQVTSISLTGKNGEGDTRTWDLGSQAFDGLGRVTRRTVGGRTTEYTYDGAFPVPATVTLPSGKTLRYAYIPELENAVSSMTTDGVTQTFSYDHLTGALLAAKEGDTENVNTWLPSGSLKTESFRQEKTTRTSDYTRTLAGGIVTYTDIAGKKTTYGWDMYGRVVTISDEALTVSLTYDALGHLSSQMVTDSGATTALTTTLGYDDFGREITRTVTDSSGTTLIVSQTWTKNDLLASRSTLLTGVSVRKEHYTYDERNRLTKYEATGSSLPVDAYGNKMTMQQYKYDALNNLYAVETRFPGDKGDDRATYFYDNQDDLSQLTSVTHSHVDYPPLITLKYDPDGRMILDEAGRTRNYDAIGRLTCVSRKNTCSVRYGYDALNRMVAESISDADSRQLYYRGGERVNEVLMQQNKITRLIKSGHTCLGMSDGENLTLTAGDHHGSLLWSLRLGQKQGQLHVWSPYGSGETTDLLPGFNGERCDPACDNYHLGNGYRAYSTVLMRFTCPDSLSPFGAGGINPYAYCAGDPVNLTDPTGHISWQGVLGIVTGVLGLAFSAFTAGASIAAAGGVMAALEATSTTTLALGGLGVLADATGIASGATEDVNPQASSALGWISMAAGLAGMAAGIRSVLRSRQVTAAARAYIRFTRVREMPIESPRILGFQNVHIPRGADDPLPNVAYTAIDTDSGVRRLNIIGHGLPGRILIENDYWVNAEGLYQILYEHGVMDYNFAVIRLICCHSAEMSNEGISLAEHLARLTGRPVEGNYGILRARETLLIPAGDGRPGGPTLAGSALTWYINDAYMGGGYWGATEFLYSNAHRITFTTFPDPPPPYAPSYPITFYP